MDNFYLLLSFSAIPFSTALIFAFLAPPLGATLSLRDEIVSAIALPPAGTAIIAILIALGLHPDNKLILYPLTVAALFGIMTFIQLYSQRSRSSGRYRSMILSALFVVSNTVVLIIKARSTHVEALFDSMLAGDLLTVSASELVTTALLALLFIITAIRFRGFIYTFTLDADLLKIQKLRYKRTMIFHRLAVTMVITGGIILIGPLLTTGLLIIPTFFIERYSTGLSRYLVTTMIVGFTGTVLGLVASLLLDLPPAPIAVSGIILTSVCGRFLERII